MKAGKDPATGVRGFGRGAWSIGSRESDLGGGFKKSKSKPGISNSVSIAIGKTRNLILSLLEPKGRASTA